MISPDWHCDEYGKNLLLKKCFCVLQLTAQNRRYLFQTHSFIKAKGAGTPALKVFHKSSNYWAEKSCEG